MKRNFSRELFYLSLIDLFKDCFAGDMELQEGGHGWEFKVKKDQRVTRIKADVNIALCSRGNTIHPGKVMKKSYVDAMAKQ